MEAIHQGNVDKQLPKWLLVNIKLILYHLGYEGPLQNGEEMGDATLSSVPIDNLLEPISAYYWFDLQLVYLVKQNITLLKKVKNQLSFLNNKGKRMVNAMQYMLEYQLGWRPHINQRQLREMIGYLFRQANKDSIYIGRYVPEYEGDTRFDFDQGVN